MADSVTIVPELPFRQQIIEVVNQITRCISDQNASKELISTFQSQLKPEEEGGDVSEERKKEIVKSVTKKYEEMKGALEGVKESDAESSHLLLHHLISSRFEGAEFEELLKSVLSGIQAGAEAANESGKSSRVESACRILNNTYNLLPSSSPLRPTTLLALLHVLSLSSDLSALPLTPSFLTQSLSQWNLPQSDSLKFLTSASEIYQSAGDLSKALEVLLPALEFGDEEVKEKAAVFAVAAKGRFEFGDVSGRGVGGKAGELLGLFEGEGDAASVKKGQDWVSANGSWVEGFNIAQFSSESVLRKLRLIALSTLCAKSASKQLSYSDVASSLHIGEDEVEGIVIDAIRSQLLTARLSQPTSTIRIQSVSSLASRNFGTSEWQLLEKRLGEWKKSVDEARRVIEEAEGLAAQGPPTHQRRTQGGGRERNERAEEVTA